MFQAAVKLTALVVQQVILLQQLPVNQEAFGCSRRVKDAGVFAQKILEHVQFGLTGLCV